MIMSGYIHIAANGIISLFLFYGRVIVYCTHIYITSFFLFLAMLGLHCCSGSSLGARTSHCGGFSCCGTRVPGHMGSAVVASGLEHTQLLWCTVLVAPWCVGSSWARDQTCASCIGSWTLYDQGSPCHILFIHLSVNGHLCCFMERQR